MPKQLRYRTASQRNKCRSLDSQMNASNLSEIQDMPKVTAHQIGERSVLPVDRRFWHRMTCSDLAGFTPADVHSYGMSLGSMALASR